MSLCDCASIDAAVGSIVEQVRRCESENVAILCCPEGALGGLADYAPRPAAIALDVESGQLARVLEPLASETVSTIVGFTEIDRRGRLFNAAAVVHEGAIIGVYRKLFPAINRSVYEAGDALPVFTIGGLTFGIMICRDSTYAEPARLMTAQGATALFVPTNNGLPPAKASPAIGAHARNDDIARATDNRAFVVRADVAGQTLNLVSYGSSGIVNPDGDVLAVAPQLHVGLVVGSIAITPAGQACQSAR
jgi:predicted amidohydrolase